MMAEPGIQLQFELVKSNFDMAGEASSKIKRVLQQIGVRSDVIRRIAIASYEAEMNVIIHAYAGTMTASVFSDRTEILLVDSGPGIPDIKQAMQEGFSTAPDHIREMGFGAGMGLPNIARCADNLDIQSEVGVGTTIKITVNH